MEKTRCLLTAIITATLFVTGFAGPVDAGRIPHFRRGIYAGQVSPDHHVYFHAARNNISNLILITVVLCQNSETGEEYLRAFDLGSFRSQDLTLRRGVARGEFDVGDDETTGSVRYRISLSGSAGRAFFGVNTQAGYETCSGSVNLRLRRARVRSNFAHP